MTIITVSMEWEVEEGFRYRVSASAETMIDPIETTRQYLHDQCRCHRRAVEAATTAHCRRTSYQHTADLNNRFAVDSLAKAKKHERDGHDRAAERAYESAAIWQAAAEEAQVKANVIEVDENYLPW